jgi:hypothetical protein
MLQRFLLVLWLASLPLTAAAEEPIAPEAVSSPTPTSAPAPAGLGPETVNPGSSTADSATLQPAGNSPLQSTTNDATGLTAPTQNALQAPATDNATLQVLLNDADGVVQGTATEKTSERWGWLLYSILIGLITTLIAFIIRSRRRWNR